MCPPDNAREAPDQPHAVERYWVRLTDEELLDAEFTTDDPTTLPELVHERPDREEVPYVEFAYDLRGSGRKVPCVHDGYDNHSRGIVMRYSSDGIRILVGRDCARNIWSVNFDHLIKDFDAARDRAHYLRRQIATREAGPTFLAALSALRKDPAIGHFERLRMQLRSALPDLAYIIDDVLQRQRGVLFVDERVRDYPAEERRAQKADEEGPPISVRQAHHFLVGMGIAKEQPKKKLDPIYTTYRRPLVALHGRDFFSSSTSPIGVRLLHFEQRTIGALEELGREQRSTTTLKKQLKGLREIVDGVLGEIEKLDSVLHAFELGNLTRLADCANSISTDGTKYRAVAGAIIAEPGRADDIVVRVPSDYRVPSPEPFKRFRDVVTG